MPHLVANFLRSSTGNISNIKKAASRSRNASCETSRNNSVSGSPYASDAEEHAVKIPDLAEAIKKHNRLSLPFRRSASKDQTPQVPLPAQITCTIESPPVIFHGSREESTGALFSGQLAIDVKDESVDVDSFTASLTIHTVHKRPYQSHCEDCQHKTLQLESWQLLAGPMTLRRGTHLFPFSTLLNGNHPASIDTPVISIAYEFKAEARLTSRTPQLTPNASPVLGSAPATPTVITFTQAVPVKRAIPEPLFPHHSVRVFPPTNIKAGADYLSVIHPNDKNKLTFKLDGLMTHHDKVKTVDLWRLKKVTWRLEETIKTVAPACDKHLLGAQVVQDDIKGLLRSETRVIGEKQIQEGWKSDYSSHDGTVDMEIEFGVNQSVASRHGSKAAKYACDTKTADGTEVSHSLLVELIVSKEYAAEGKTHITTPTGTGRILRMHFGVVMTESPGLGVSWDNEAPPVYGEVPPSPPNYIIEDCPIDYEDLEALDSRRSSSDASSSSV
ncbi:hypothetical protein VHEMI02428 [[Torrubiella] hemipterigena]|uniref:LDB19 N-terminal domain-containing protein n=1 Tax=[Torrubiella] hemipterigena TaxID=1531966 RepID=A0A0A1T7U5_9HYPO|nr:hypothetical protein VHEMI02428 [[Torrubiella] hemipterigena]